VTNRNSTTHISCPRTLTETGIGIGRIPENVLGRIGIMRRKATSSDIANPLEKFTNLTNLPGNQIIREEENDLPHHQQSSQTPVPARGKDPNMIAREAATMNPNQQGKTRKTENAKRPPHEKKKQAKWPLAN